MSVSKFAALIASISLPGRDLVDPMPKIETNVSSSISSGIIIPKDITSAFFSAIFFCVTGNATGFIIADVIPAPIAIGKNALLIPCRLGNPKEILDAPHVVFTPNSSLNLRTRVNT